MAEAATEAEAEAEAEADAKAEGSDVCVGGFELVEGASLLECRWFSISLNPENAPWAFVREGEALRAIASLELFASLLCVMLFVLPERIDASTQLTLTGVSDNKGNEALINKNLTSKFPLYIVLLELTEQLQLRNLLLDLRWQPREFNQAADDLSNRLFGKFDPKLRICSDLEDMHWIVFPKLLAEATSLHFALKARKAEIAEKRKFESVATGTPKKSKRKSAGLRTTDPW